PMLINIVVTTYYPDSELGRMRKAAAQNVMKSWDALVYEGHLQLIMEDDSVRKGVGASLNRGFKRAFQTSPLAMYMVDDWMLNEYYDLDPWVKLIEEHEDIGMIRLGPPHPGLTGKIVHDDNRWYMRLDRHDYVYGMRPALYHKRFFDAYGWFKEGVSAVECEQDYNVRFCDSRGPDIIYALPTPWEHIRTLDLGELQPCQN
ncbi:MAG: hypothetical protein U1D67_04975, partial [Dehalococcoidia bacterium]|nr:hypothetical protein [Dehalococcoidia bacterium]